MAESLNRPVIDALAVYSAHDVARLTGTGVQSVYRPIRRGQLRAARVNERGDLRIRGEWLLTYLDALAAAQAAGPDGR